MLVLGPIEGVRIVGGGTAYPSRVVTNADAIRSVAEWALPGKRLDDDRLAFMATGVEETLGVRERGWTHVPGTPFDHAREETTVDLAVRAARAALADAGLGPLDLPLIICSTSTPPRMTSTVSAAVGAALGASNAACFDVRTGCSGALFSLATAGLYLASGIERALVIGTETFSKVIPKESKIAAVSLGDGAAAVILERGAGRIASAALMTDGTLGAIITTDGALPPTEEEITRGGYVLSGAPETLSAVVPGKYAEAIDTGLARAGDRPVDLFVPHQTSLPLIRAVAERASIAESKTFVNIHRHANVGTAGVMGALVEARAEGRMQGRVLCAAVGGGMSWASVVLDC